MKPRWLSLPHIYAESIEIHVLSKTNILWIIGALLVMLLTLHPDFAIILHTELEIVFPFFIIFLSLMGINILTLRKYGFYSFPYRLTHFLVNSFTILGLGVLIFFTGDPRTAWWALFLYLTIHVAQTVQFHWCYLLLFIFVPIMVTVIHFLNPLYPVHYLWKVYPLLVAGLAGGLYTYQCGLKRRELAIRERNERLFDQMRHMQLRTEKERISRELHDSLGATLTGNALLSQIALGELNRGNLENVQESILKIENNAKTALKQMREVVFEINQRIDIVSNFDKTLDERGKELLTPANIQWELASECTIDRAEKDETPYLAILRIFEEWINNIIRHSGASRVVSHLIENEEGIFIDIEDNGKGMEKDKIKYGQGIPNIHFRVNELSGKVTITSIKGENTRIEIRLPYTQKTTQGEIGEAI